MRHLLDALFLQDWHQPFLLYFPCLSFMKHVDVSSHYFFLIVIMDKLNISLVMLGMFNDFHSVQTHHNTELITFL